VRGRYRHHHRASKTLARLGVNAPPTCGEDGTLRGVLAFGREPNAATAGDLAHGRSVAVGAGNSVEEALKVMISTTPAICPS